jgi:hypothetical protein
MEVQWSRDLRGHPADQTKADRPGAEDLLVAGMAITLSLQKSA